jgi:hypothetical protein
MKLFKFITDLAILVLVIVFGIGVVNLFCIFTRSPRIPAATTTSNTLYYRVVVTFNSISVTSAPAIWQSPK